MKIKNLDIKDFNYILPEEKIAKYPLKERDKSKLLVFDKGQIIDSTFINIADYLNPETVLVTNNSKVIPARLIFQKPTGAKIEIFCLEPTDKNDLSEIFASKRTVRWNVIIGNAKRWKEDNLEQRIKINNKEVVLTATKIKNSNEQNIVEFRWNSNNSFGEIIENVGKIPIPPYLQRDTEKIDKERYQTVYAKVEGSVAAPTAGLHFTDKVFEKLKNKGIKNIEITLHVSAGTFKPLKSNKIIEHKMHEEWVVISKSQIEKLEKVKHITVVGTTSLRALESIYWLGVNIYNEKNELKVKQWQPYKEKSNLKFSDALNQIKLYMTKNRLDTLTFPTEIIIVPGYKVKSAKALITNFHQPQSTLLLLIAALVGNNWKKIYNHALQNNYRFLSYGDASLLKFGV